MTEQLTAIANPVLERGEVTLKNFMGLAQAKLNQATILVSRRGGYRVVSVARPISYMEAIVGGFTNFVRIDTTPRSMTRTETAQSLYSGYAHTLKIDMAARIYDPEIFLNQFGETTDIFEPFYRTWLGQILGYARRYGPEDVDQLEEKFAELDQNVRERETIYAGVQILTFQIRVDADPKFSQDQMLRGIITAVEKNGPKAAVALKLMRPELGTKLDTFLADLKKIRDSDATENDTEWYKAINRVQKLVELGFISREEAAEYLKISENNNITQYQIHSEQKLDPKHLPDPARTRKDS